MEVKFYDEVADELLRFVLLDELPTEWTYTLIPPLLIEEYERRI